uniref:Secreted protein n=1 Tax=Rhizophora mucronata TaxID=61149 RepID=A0A2P2JGB2_RHIMU
MGFLLLFLGLFLSGKIILPPQILCSSYKLCFCRIQNYSEHVIFTQPALAFDVFMEKRNRESSASKNKKAKKTNLSCCEQLL